MRRATQLSILASALTIACGGSGDSTAPSGPGISVLARPARSDTIDAIPSQQLTVEVRGADGPRAGVAVQFTTVPDIDSLRPFERRMAFPPANPNSLAPSTDAITDTTDASGHVSVRIQFGTLVGDARVVVTCQRLGLSDTLQFTVLPGTPAIIGLPVSDTIVAVGGSYSLGAYAMDRWRNRLPTALTYVPALNATSVDPSGRVTASTAIGKGRVVVRASATAADTARFTVLPRVPVAMFWWPWDQNGKIVSANLDGSNWKVLTNAGGPAYPSPSPTRQEVAYHQYSIGGGLHLYVVDSTGIPRLLVDSNVVRDARFPRFSADGQRVYFAGQIDSVSTRAIFRVRRDGTGLERIVGLTALNDFDEGEQVGVSPDETHIVYRDGLGINVLTMATGAKTVIASSGSQPTFSPDGQRIAYTNVNNLVVITGVDGTVQKSIPFQYWSDDGLTWLPDGRWLLLRTATGVTLLDTVSGEQLRLPSFAEQHQMSIGY